MTAIGGGGIGKKLVQFVSGNGGGRSAVQITNGVDAVTAGGGGGGSECHISNPAQDCGGGGGNSAEYDMHLLYSFYEAPQQSRVEYSRVQQSRVE
jgi:hypothetical protein